ncbi:MAG: hypothetical protein ACREA4_03650 [Nitrososphaera sp.]
MANPAATQILSFENFGALESHLRILKAKYNEMVRNYEETLGFVLRDTKPGSVKNQLAQQKWVQEMQEALTTNDKTRPGTVKKDDGKKMFGGKDKEKQGGAVGEWVTLDPMSVYVGPKNRGLAEIYFDTINILKENVGKINLALSICSAVKAKAAMSGNTSLVVSFVNDIPTKVLLKSADDSASKKYTMSFSFAVPSMPPAAQSLK